MPIYSIQGPDGNTYSIEGPEGATREQVINAIQLRMMEQPAPAPAPAPVVAPPPPSGGFFPALARGAIQTQSLITDIIPAMVGRAIGADEYAEQQFKEAAEKEKLIQEKYAAAVPSYKDIKGVGDFVTYVTESVGELVPSIIPSLITGGAAGVLGRGAIIAAKEAAEVAARKGIAQGLAADVIEAKAKEAGLKAAANTALKYEAVGAVAGSASQNIPDVYKNIKDETGQESLGTALLFGGFNSLLDAALPIATLAKIKKAGIPGEELMGEWYKRFGKGAVKGFATEGATEAAQEMSSAAAEKFVDENKEFFTEKNLERFLNAGLKGGLGGGVVSGSTDVMLGKKKPTEDELIKQLRPGETLEQGINRIYGDLTANRAFLDELHAMQAKEGQTILNDDALKSMGFKKDDPLYPAIIDKDLNNTQDSSEVVDLLKAAIADPKATENQKTLYADSLSVIEPYLSTRGVPSVETVTAPDGAGVPVAGVPSVRAAAPGVGVLEPIRVAPAPEVTGQPPAGAPVVSPPVAPSLKAVPVETPAPAPIEAPAAVQTPAPAPIEAPSQSPVAAPAAAPVEAPVAAPVEPPAPPTTEDLIKTQQERIGKLTQDFQTLLQHQINRYGLKDVAVNVVSDLKDANGTYSNRLIKLAIDADDPVRDLRHEAIHAMKELGVFTPAQWTTLMKMASDKWIDQHLKGKNISGNAIQEGEQSRHDAYRDLYGKRGMSEAQIQEALVEEAIADAFGGFAQTKAPPGFLSAILNRMNNFFRAIKETVGMSAPETAEQIFGKVAQGKLAPKEKAVAPTEEAKPVETEEKFSLAPKGIPQNLWDLHEKSIKATEEASGEITREKGLAPGGAKRNQTMSFRRLNNAVMDFVGGDEQKSLDLMSKMNAISGIRDAIKSEDSRALDMYKVTNKEEYDQEVAPKQAEKPSLKAKEKPVIRPAENEVIKNVAKHLPLSQEMFNSTSLGLQTGKSGKDQFIKNNIGGIPEIISYLERRRKESGLPILDIANERDRVILANLMASEAMASIDAGGAALEWYDETIAKTIGMAALKYGDLAKDLNQQMAFKLATSIASQGMNVEDNLIFAMRQFDYFRRNNRFEEIGTGTDAKAMKTNYILANKMFEKYGLEQTRRFLATPFTVEELRSAGFEIGGELGDEVVLGSSIFGPKIGFGFYSNLNGNFEPVTMDMWFMRLIGRLTGKLRLLDKDLLATQIDRFRKSFSETGENGVYADEVKEDILEKARTNNEDAIELARAVNSAFNADFRSSRELYDEGARVKTEFVSAAQRILNSVDFPKDAPQNGTERRQLRDVVNRTVKQIEEVLGRRIPPASLQALVWYPEQELYSALGAKLRVTSQDYAGAMRKILKGEGYGTEQLDRAADDGARQVRSMVGKPSREETGLVGAKPGVSYAEEERQTFLEKRQIERVIEQEREKPRRHKVVFEVAPDPNNKTVVDAWRGLPNEDRLRISDKVMRQLLPKIMEEFGGNGRIASQVGSYLDDTNPSFALYLDKGNPIDISKYLGYILGQDSMMVISPRPAPGLSQVGAVVVDVKTQDAAKINEIYQRLHQIRVGEEQPIQGQSTINEKMVVLNYSNLSTNELATVIAKELAGEYDVATTEVYSAFPEKDSYDYSNPETDPRGEKGNLRGSARTLRSEATNLLAKELGTETKPAETERLSIRAPKTDEFERFFEGSKARDEEGNPLLYYHGSVRDKRMLRPKVAGAIFFSPDPSFAEGYIQYKLKELAERPGDYLSAPEIRDAVRQLRQYVYDTYGRQSKTAKDMLYEITEIEDQGKKIGVYKFRGELGDVWRGDEANFGLLERKMQTGRNLTPVFISVKNPFDYEDKKQVAKVINKLTTSDLSGDKMEKLGLFKSGQTFEDQEKIIKDYYRDKIASGDWRTIETPEVQEAIRDLKHDGFYAAEDHTEGATKNLAVYSKDQAKSAVGNVGAYGQRAVTEEEAKGAGLTQEEAQAAQKEGDIRFSLKASKEFFDRAEKIPESKDVETIRESWIGGVSGVGDRDIAYNLPFVKGGEEYTKRVQDFIKKELGDSFVAFRLMSKDELEELRAGAVGTQLASFTFNQRVAEAFKNIPRYSKRNDLVVVEMDFTPEHVQMLGHPGEQEVVIDYAVGYDPTNIRVVKGQEKPRYSIKAPESPEFKRWFGKSKIVNADGTPKVMYHGTALDFNIFKPGRANAIFLTDDPDFANFFASLSESRTLVEIFNKIDQDKTLKLDLITNLVDDAIANKRLATKENSNGLYKTTRDEHINFFMGQSLAASSTSIGIGQELNNIANNFKETGENIIPVYVRAENPFDYQNPRHIAKLKNQLEISKNLEKAIFAGSWRAIELDEVQDALTKTGFDSFYIKEGSNKNLAVKNSNQLKSATGNIGTYDIANPDIRYSLRSTVNPAITARMEQTTTARKQEGFIKNITTAFRDPDFRSKFRAQTLNRYNRLSEYDKIKLEQSGGMDLYADATAESAALMSDLGAGILASAFGVHDKVGGAPVYKRHYIVQKVIQAPNGMDTFTQVGSQYSDRATAESVAQKVGGVVRERGYTGVSNFDGSVKGPLAIFAPLAKYKDPEIYRYYQFWAGVRRGTKYMALPLPGGGFTVKKENLFDPKDIAKADELEKQFPEFKTVKEEWIKYNDQLVNYMRDTGVISKEQADEFIQHGDYMPFYRQTEDGADPIGPRIFQSIGHVQAPKKLKHGEDPLGDFLENVVRNSEAAIQSGVKNIAARRAADVGMDVGTVKKLDHVSTNPNDFYVMENGKKVYYKSSDILFIEAIKSLGLPNVPFIGILAAPANVLRNLVTRDPGFMLANMMRDSLSAWATTGVKMTPMVATLKNFATALADKSPEMKAMHGSGVLGGYEYSRGVQDAAKQFEKELSRHAGAATTKEKALRPVTYIWEALEKGTSASDAATRIEVYKKTLQETGNEAEALFRSLEVMNFNRKGANPILRVATAAIPFLNARMQGLDVLYRAGFGENATKNAKEIQKTFFIRGATMMALSSMYWMLTHDDDDYKKQEQETRDNNWLLPSLGIRIPIPFEVGVMFKVIPERILELTFGQDTVKDFTVSMARQLASTLAFNPIPQAALPIVEYATNYSFFTGRPIVGQGMENVSPAYQAGPATSRVAQTIGEATKGLPSYLQLSPLKIDQLINGYTGTMGMYMVDLMDSIYDMHSDSPKPSKRFEQLPVFKRFLIDPEARGQVTSYYDLKNSVDEATRTENLLQRSMKFEDYGQYMKDNIKMFAVKSYVLDLEKTMKQYNEMKLMIRNSKMDADAKRDALLNIQRAENQLTKNIQMLKKNID